MTQEAIDKALAIGESEHSPEGTILGDLHGGVDHNEFECDDIEGVHDCDPQHNLCQFHTFK